MLKRPYFVRLMLFGICISMFPMLVLGFFLTHKAAGSIQRKADEANAYILYQKRQQVEQVITIVNQLSIQFITSSLVYDVLPRKLQPADFRQIENVKQAMGNTLSLEPSIRDIYFVNTEHLWSISNTGWVSYEGIDEMAPLIRYANPAALSDWVIPEEQDLVFGRDVALLVKNMPAYSSKPQGFLIVVLSLQSLAKLIDEPGTASQTMILDDGKRLIAGDQAYGEQVLAMERWEGETDAYGSDRTVLTHEGSRLVVQRQQSIMNDWQYVTVTSMHEVTKDARNMLGFTLIIAGAMVVIVIVMAGVGSSSIYRPIKRLVALVKGSERKFSFERSSDEVAFIYDRIQIQSNQLKEFFMTKLCQGLVPKHQVRQRFAEHGFSAEGWTWLLTAVLQIDSLTDTRFEEKDRDLLLFAINNIVHDIVAKQDCLIPIVMGYSQVTVFTDEEQSEAAFLGKVDGYLKSIQTAIRDVLGISVSIGVSRVFNAPNVISNSYQEGLEALQYRLSLGGNAILHIQDVEVIESKRNGYPFAEAEALMNAVKTLEPTESIQQRLEAVLHTILLESNSAREQQTYLGQLVFEWIGWMQKAGDQPTDRMKGIDSFIASLMHLSSKEEVQQVLFDTLIKPTLETWMGRRHQHYQSIVTSITDIVEQEFSQNLTLEACAERLNYHPDYIGRVFRKEMGVGFAEYLSAYRLKLAKQLLRDTDMKISVIARQIGYSNPQNFIRHFRKVEAMTPGVFREQHT